MSEFLERQKALFHRAIDDYRSGRLHLDALVRRVESLSDAIDSQSWRDEFFPIVLAMEQINAIALERNGELTEADKSLITNLLHKLESLIDRYQLG